MPVQLSKHGNMFIRSEEQNKEFCLDPVISNLQRAKINKLSELELDIRASFKPEPQPQPEPELETEVEESSDSLLTKPAISELKKANSISSEHAIELLLKGRKTSLKVGEAVQANVVCWGFYENSKLTQGKLFGLVLKIDGLNMVLTGTQLPEAIDISDVNPGDQILIQKIAAAVFRRNKQHGSPAVYSISKQVEVA